MQKICRDSSISHLWFFLGKNQSINALSNTDQKWGLWKITDIVYIHKLIYSTVKGRMFCRDEQSCKNTGLVCEPEGGGVSVPGASEYRNVQFHFLRFRATFLIPLAFTCSVLCQLRPVICCPDLSSVCHGCSTIYLIWTWQCNLHVL